VVDSINKDFPVLMAFYALYNMFLMILVVALAPCWIVWMLLVPKVRAGFFQKLGFLPQAFLQRVLQLPVENRIWLHAVSVGELNASKPLINRLIEKDYPMVLSTTTATGNALARQLYPDLPIFYFPFDFPWAVNKVLGALKPSVVVILETEIWPNLLYHASRYKVPVLMLNGRLSERSFKGYCRLKGFFQWVLGYYTCMIMQSVQDADRVKALGVDESKVLVAGNIKFDLPTYEDSSLYGELKVLFQFPVGAPVIVFASSHKGEDEIFIDIYNNLLLDFPDLRTVLAPRHPERVKSIITMLANHGTHFILRSQLTPESPNSAGKPVVVLDTIGELNAVFSLASVACMGGSFIPWGGHNPIEPINAGIPVVFGPSMENFREIAQRVLEAQAGFRASTPQEAQQLIRELLTRPEYYRQIVQNGEHLLADNRGVTHKLVSVIEDCLTKEGARTLQQTQT
jgi:3-deoxy-D-manno-octulosonic-acid transferase